MTKALIPFLLIILVSCGSKREDGVPVSSVEDIGFNEDLGSLAPVENVCDVFSAEHNFYFEEFQGSFPGNYSSCLENTELSTNKESAVMESYAFAFEIFGAFDREAHKKCVPLAKRLIKNIYSTHLRNLKPEISKRMVQKVLSKARLDNQLRSLIRFNCLPDFNNFTYVYEGEEKQFEFLSNHLLNGSFEYFKEEDSRQFTELGREWTLVNAKKIPGWMVKAVNPVEGKNCDYLEFQGSNVVTATPDGRHVVELDSHCTNDQDRNVSGDARVELIQQVAVKEPGSYRLTLKAQKRGGSHGELEISIFQRKRDKEFERIELPNQAVWSDVCVDVEIQEIEKNLKISLRDGEESGRHTLGLLIDDVSFELGSCE